MVVLCVLALLVFSEFDESTTYSSPRPNGVEKAAKADSAGRRGPQSEGRGQWFSSR